MVEHPALQKYFLQRQAAIKKIYVPRMFLISNAERLPKIYSVFDSFFFMFVNFSDHLDKSVATL